jgi:hypothetical protein
MPLVLLSGLALDFCFGLPIPLLGFFGRQPDKRRYIGN